MLLAAVPALAIGLILLAALVVFAFAGGGGGSTCPQTAAEAEALGAKVRPELDAWLAENPSPNASDIEGSRAWFKSLISKVFSLMGPCFTSERSDFARDVRKGFVLMWVSTLIDGGQINESMEDVVAWVVAHPTWDPLDGMPWDFDPVLPPALEGTQAAITPTLQSVLGAAVAVAAGAS